MKCEKCNRNGILFCQYVMPNVWSREEKAFVRKPWVFRAYYCRWHLAAENMPKNLKRLGGKKRNPISFISDEELIATWEKENPQT